MPKLRLLLFDIDGTLASVNKPIEPEVVTWLHRVSSQGVTIGFMSGKPVSYLSGMARQLGLDKLILVGENGANIYYSGKFPPKKHYGLFQATEQKTEHLRQLEARIMDQFKDSVWFQPNLINLTVFPKSIEMIDRLHELILQAREDMDDFDANFEIYRHADSVEVVPVEINKGAALEKIIHLEGITKEEVIAVGDGENDRPMLMGAGLSIGINLDGYDYKVEDIQQALNIIEEKLHHHQ